MINVVILNGGRGASTLIPEILNNPEIKLTSIVNAYDDGKSTGEIRKFFNMLGPSDIRKVQELMLPDDLDQVLEIRKLFSYRFPEDCSNSEALNVIDEIVKNNNYSFLSENITSKPINRFIKESLNLFCNYLQLNSGLQEEHFNFADCSIMNCIYAGAFLLYERNIDEVSQHIEKIFSLSGSVMPTNIENKFLVAIRENGDVLYSEADIVELRSSVRIDKLFLLDYPLKHGSLDSLSIENRHTFLEYNKSFVKSSERVELAIRLADIIIYSSGTQHSSLYPTYMTQGIADAISKNTFAKKFFVTNIGEDYETPSYKASDFLKGALKYLNYSSNKSLNYKDFFDYVLINDTSDNDPHLINYDKENFEDLESTILVENFESELNKGKHDGQKLLELIMGSYLNE